MPPSCDREGFTFGRLCPRSRATLSRARTGSQVCGSETLSMSQVHQTPRQDRSHPSSRAPRQRHSPVHLGLYECPQNRHQLLVLQVVCALNGHVQDVDWLFFEVLGGKTQRWAMEGPGAPACPLLGLLPAQTLTLPSSSQYKEERALPKRGLSLGTLAKQEMTSSKFLGVWGREQG